MPALVLPTDLSVQSNGARQVSEGFAATELGPSLDAAASGCTNSQFAGQCTELAGVVNNDMRTVAAGVASYADALDRAASNYELVDSGLTAAAGGN